MHNEVWGSLGGDSGYVQEAVVIWRSVPSIPRQFGRGTKSISSKNSTLKVSGQVPQLELWIVSGVVQLNHSVS